MPRSYFGALFPSLPLTDKGGADPNAKKESGGAGVAEATVATNGDGSDAEVAEATVAIADNRAGDDGVVVTIDEEMPAPSQP